MHQKINQKLLACLFCLGMLLCSPFSAFATVTLEDFTKKLSLGGDLMIRYEYREMDVSNEDENDRLLQQFRLGVKFETTENWTIAAGLATGGMDARFIDDTYSENSFFETNDIRLDYAYSRHTFNNFQFLAGQHKNPFQTTWALWDDDVRPVGLTGKIDLTPAFITLGWYDVYYADNDMAQMEAVQIGADLDMMTAALAFYNYHNDALEIMGANNGLGTFNVSNLDEDYNFQIIDLYLAASIDTGAAKISPHAQVFYNMGAEGEEGQSLQGGNLDPEEENMGYLVGVCARLNQFKFGIDYASIGADACNPLLNDGYFGDSLNSTDVEGFKIGVAYNITPHCSLGGTAYLYEAKERNIDRDPKTYHVDLSYQF